MMSGPRATSPSLNSTTTSSPRIARTVWFVPSDPGAEEGSTEVLSLDQIMRTNDVKVYVRAAAGPDQPAMDSAPRKPSPRSSLALVNGLLFK